MPEQMTRETAENLVAAMVAETPRNARIALLKLALGPFGNLTDAAKDVYRAQLERDRANA